jgi:hypothetical protein
MPSGVNIAAEQHHEPKLDALEKVMPPVEASDVQGRENEDAAAEQGVEVVLGDEEGTAKVVVEEPCDRKQDVFRHSQDHPMDPRDMHPRRNQPYSVHGSESWGYGPPPPQHGVYPPPPRPYPVPAYAASASFDDPGSYHQHITHYTPHIQYPPPRYGEEVNVISPNHKDFRGSPSRRGHGMPPPHNYYHYPPTSPVSRPGGMASGPPRVRSYAMRRGQEGAYPKSQRGYYHHQHPEESWRPSVARSHSDEKRRHPRLVAELSFDSDPHPRESHPSTPGSVMLPPAQATSDPYFYGPGSWGSFDSAAAPPPHYDYSAESPYVAGYMPPYSPAGGDAGLYHGESFPHGYGSGSFSYSYDQDEVRMLQGYHPDQDAGGHNKVTPKRVRKGKRDQDSANMLLPEAAEEVDFDVADPPMEPITPPSEHSLVDSLANVNGHDVICGRGGGTNSQVGNRRFRKLVQDFQPTYLLARRKEKPLLARTIVLIIRKRGGRFLKKDDDSGEMYEVGDVKAEAKTSQALREGLDVRATKSAASSLLEKKKKNSKKAQHQDDDTESSPMSVHSEKSLSPKMSPAKKQSPPTLPRLAGEEVKAGTVHPHSPDQTLYRKRRRMRTDDSFPSDRLFPEFCPPRADLGGPAPNDAIMTPLRRSQSRDDDDIRYDAPDTSAVSEDNRGCAGIALDMVTGATGGSFCLSPSGWRC